MDNGYIILARKMMRFLIDKPPLWSALWVWMLFKANFKDRDKLKRGQFVTTINEMREAMSYWAGNRKIVPTKDQIRNVYGGFSKTTMITTSKTTRGMIITILNYDHYQNPKTFESHTESRAENRPTTTAIPHDTKRSIKKEKGLSKDKPQSGSGSKHYSVSYSDLASKIKDHCLMLKTLSVRHKVAFNPFAWVQQQSNKNGHPQAIVVSLKALEKKMKKEYVSNPWGYLKRTFEIQNGNYNEADARKESEAFKKITLKDGEFLSLVGSIGTSI